MRNYDILLMFPATIGPEDVDRITKKIFEVAASHGVELESIDRWPKRRFAYEVKHHTEGYYCDVLFRATPEGLAELDRLCRLEDTVLRHKVTSRVVRPAPEPTASEAPPASGESQGATI